MSTSQEDAPYPADLDHLDNILELSSAGSLPEGATNIKVAPAAKFAASYPGGWGYVITFHANEDAILQYLNDVSGKTPGAIEMMPDARPNASSRADIDFSGIEHPFVIIIGNTELLFERPLGRGWLQVRGAPR